MLMDGLSPLPREGGLAYTRASAMPTGHAAFFFLVQCVVNERRTWKVSADSPRTPAHTRGRAGAPGPARPQESARPDRNCDPFAFWCILVLWTCH